MGLRERETGDLWSRILQFEPWLNKDSSLTDALVGPTGGGKGASLCFLPFTEQEVTTRPYGDVSLRLGFTANFAAGRLFVAEQAGCLWRI